MSVNKTGSKTTVVLMVGMTVASALDLELFFTKRKIICTSLFRRRIKPQSADPSELGRRKKSTRNLDRSRIHLIATIV